MTSLSDKLAVSNRPAGFDYMRLGLASCVILHHSFTVTTPHTNTIHIWNSPDRAVVGLILPLFFALSGFLVCGSLERNKSLVSFLGLRAIRLVPALMVEVVLSAFILGAALTVLPLYDYFASPLIRSYFLNIIGDIHYRLPGVFLHNPDEDLVNAQLWTLPSELRCYMILAAVAFVGITARKWWLLAAMMTFQVVMVTLVLLKHPDSGTMFPGKVLVGSFLAGVLLYKFRDRIPSSFPLFCISLAATVALLLIPRGDYLIPLPAAYATVYIGSLNPPRSRLLLSGDYSYGLYLYGYPLQQAFTTLGPWTYTWWVDFLWVYPAAFAFAAFSWWAIEKPALSLKRYISACEDWYLRVPALSWHSRRVFSKA